MWSLRESPDCMTDPGQQVGLLIAHLYLGNSSVIVSCRCYCCWSDNVTGDNILDDIVHTSFHVGRVWHLCCWCKCTALSASHSLVCCWGLFIEASATSFTFPDDVCLLTHKQLQQACFMWEPKMLITVTSRLAAEVVCKNVLHLMKSQRYVAV